MCVCTSLVFVLATPSLPYASGFSPCSTSVQWILISHLAVSLISFQLLVIYLYLFLFFSRLLLSFLFYLHLSFLLALVVGFFVNISAVYISKHVSTHFTTFRNLYPQTKIDSLRIMAQCINTTALDNLFLSACCAAYVSSKYLPDYGTWDLESRCKKVNTGKLTSCPLKPSNLPFHPPGVFTSDGACNRITFLKEQTKRVDSVFDCTSLPVCKVTCSGPNRNIIHSVCKRCSCMVEWLFNAIIFQVTGGIIVYLIMNFTRVMICRGMIMVFWRSLTKEEFEVKTTCSRSGEILLQTASLWGNKESRTEERIDGEEEGSVRVRRVNLGDADKRKDYDGNDNDGDGEVGNEYTNNQYNNKTSPESRYNQSGVDDNDDEDVYERYSYEAKGCSLGVRTRKSMQVINERLEKMLNWLVIRGWMYTLLGLALNGVWLVVLMKVQRSISYNPAA